MQNLEWNQLSLKEKAELIRIGVANGITDLKDILNRWNSYQNEMSSSSSLYTSNNSNIYNEYSEGGDIHIKPENRGKFTALKERTGKSSTWYKEHGTPAQKKMAVFALNARKWNHKHDGIESDSLLHTVDSWLPAFAYSPTKILLLQEPVVSKAEQRRKEDFVNFIQNYIDVNKIRPLSYGGHLFDEGGDKTKNIYWVTDDLIKQSSDNLMLNAIKDLVRLHYERVRRNDSQTAKRSEKYEDEMNDRLKMHKKTYDHKWDIPYIEDKEIKILGNRISSNLLDSLAKYAQKQGVPISEAIGLAAYESYLGNLPYYNYSNYKKNATAEEKKQTDENNRALANANFFRNYGYIPAWAVVRDNEWEKEGYDFTKDFKKNGMPPLEHAMYMYRTNRYNPKLYGDKNAHTKRVKEKATLIEQDKNYIKWKKLWDMEQSNQKADGGYLELFIDSINTTNYPEFWTRLNADTIRTIPDWEEQNKVASHKMSYANSDGRYIIYPQIQERNGRLVDYSLPYYNRFTGLNSALQTGNYIVSPDSITADLFTRNYKDYFTGFNLFKAQGGYLDNLTTKPFSYYPIPTVRYDDGGFMNNVGYWLRLKLGLDKVNKNNIAVRLAYTESGFDSSAVSPKGAAGIFLIKQNALDDYNNANNTTYKTTDLKNDTLSTLVRNWVMDLYMNRPWNTKNNPSDSVRTAKALAAYNYGATNMINGLNKAKAAGKDIYGSSGTIDWSFMDYWPLETQDYVNFILRGQNNSLHRNDTALSLKKKMKKKTVKTIKNTK